MSYSKLLPVIVFYSLLGGTVVAADTFFSSDESDAIYGKGVHAFFDQNYEEAVKILSKIEELKTNDPRPYYFMGLAHLRQKHTEQADQYFKQAAQMEYSGRALRHYAVPESLRRIQGEERLRIEKVREEERTNARVRDQRTQEARYGAENAAAREALRHSAAPANPNENLPVVQPAAQKGNVFGAKPLDPTRQAEETIVSRRTEGSPFGEITVTTEEIPEVAVPTPTSKSPRRSTATDLPPERVFVGIDGTTVRQETAVKPTGTGAGESGVPGAASSTAKGFGRAFGSLFSKKGNNESEP